MTKQAAVLEPRHPKGVKLSQALAEDEPRRKAMKGQIDKKATLIKASDDPEIQKELAVNDGMKPDATQLAKVNEFTRSPKSADEVAVFPTLSCNDLVDRDDDQFTTQCVKDFAALDQPFSPTGKSFMLDHAYSTKNQVGRIFDTEAKKVGGVQWLKNQVYVPNIADNQTYLQNVDFGVHWAVSVGVVLGKSMCSVCDAGFSSWGWWCVNGHDKGLWYDPKSDEEDSWGYPAPCDPKTAGAIKCVQQFSEPKDMYELSQVFLGAQYFAALDKDPAFKGFMKAASAGNIPVIGLKAEEAKKLPLSHEPEEVSSARLSFTVKQAEDGSLNWTDAHGIRWTFDPEDPESGVCSIGKATAKQEDNDESEEDEEDGEVSEEQLSQGDGDQADDEESESESDDEAGDGGTGSEGDQSSAGGEQQRGGQGSLNEDASDEDEEDEEESDDNEEKALSGEAVLAAARKAKLSEKVIEAVSKAKSDPLGALLKALDSESAALAQSVTDLTPKAALGEQYIEELRSDAIHWYVVSHQEKDGEKVQTENIMKILDAVGDNVELLKAHVDEYQATAKAKFPKRVRSSFPTDIHDPDQRKGSDKEPKFMEELRTSDEDKKVRSIHG